MSTQDMDALCRRLLGEIAPEADLDALDATAPMAEELDLDSMDLLNLYTAVHEETGVDIPEADYAKVATLADLVEYVSAREAS